MKDLCNRLPKTETEACISVQKYLSKLVYKHTKIRALEEREYLMIIFLFSY